MKELLNGITDKKIIAKRKKENPKRETEIYTNKFKTQQQDTQTGS